MVVIVANDPEAMVKFAHECQEEKIPYLFDPSQQIPRLTAKELLSCIKGSKVTTVNDYELQLMMKKTNLFSPRTQME